MVDDPQSVIEHLTELRQRIIYSAVALALAVGVSMVFAHRAFTYVLSTAAAGGQVTIVQNQFSDAFLTEFRLAVYAGLVLAFPFVLYQLVAFILPALRPGERRLLYLGLPFAAVLFMAGWLFGWFVVMPISRRFFLDVASGVGIENLITPTYYLSFVLSICNPLGIAFELPLVVAILARLGIVSATLLRRGWRYAVLGLMIIAAVLSPPDVVSMLIFLIPLYGLYELSILMAKIAAPKAK